jgi:hypothetical protein
MRLFLFLLIFIGFASMAFCTKDVDDVFILSVHSGRFLINVPALKDKMQEKRGLENQDISLQKQVLESCFSPQTGDLIVEFSGLDNPAGFSVKNQQQLQFENPEGQLVSMNLPVRESTLVGQTLCLNFILSGVTFGKLKLLSSQSVVMENKVED